MNQETLENIGLIRRMGLRIAKPKRFTGVSRNVSNVDVVTAETIYVPDIFTSYELVIRDLQNEIRDIKKATRIMLDIKKEQPND
jgi:hypothetical protein